MLALLLGALALSAPLLRVAAEEEDLVTVLTEANFEESIKGSKFALVRGRLEIVDAQGAIFVRVLPLHSLIL